MAGDSRRLNDISAELANLPREVKRQQRDLEDSATGRGQEQRLRKAALQRADELAREAVDHVRREVNGDPPDRDEAEKIADEIVGGI